MTTYDLPTGHAVVQSDLRVILELADAISDVVKASPQGAPAGHLYAALMGVMSLERFEQFMDILVRAGRVRREGLLYFPVLP